MPPTCTTRRTRPSAGWSSATCPRPAACRWSPTCPRRILSRPIDVSSVRPDLRRRAEEHRPVGPDAWSSCARTCSGAPAPSTPAVFDYQALADERSMLNTPPTFAWYVAGLVFKWLKRQGGLAAMARAQPRQGASCSTQAIDASGFYRNPVAKDCALVDERALHAAANRSSTQRSSPRPRAAGLINLKGHRVGRRHARQPLQRHAARGCRGAGGVHARVRAPPRLSSAPHGTYRILTLNNISARGLERLPPRALRGGPGNRATRTRSWCARPTCTASKLHRQVLAVGARRRGHQQHPGRGLEPPWHPGVQRPGRQRQRGEGAGARGPPARGPQPVPGLGFRARARRRR